MKTPALEQAEGELNNLRKGLKDVLDEAGPDLDMSKVKSVSGDKITWVREQKKQIDEAAQRVREMTEVAGIAEANAKEFFESGDGPSSREIKTRDGDMALGEAFVNSPAFKSRHVVSHLDNVNLKTLFQRSTSWDPEETRSGKLVLDAQRPAPNVVNFIPNAPVNQSAYKYMEETTFTNNAAETAEGALFGEAVLALTEQTQTVQKVAVWIPVTDEQLEDVEGAEAYLNQRLQFMLQQRVDLQVLQGDATGSNLLGTENVTGIQSQALGSDTTIDALHKVFTDIRESAFAEPSVVFIRPSKWQDVILQKTADGQYIWGHPSVNGPQTAWGVPVVQTTAVTATKAVTGDYTTHSLLGLKRGIDMQVTNSHSDFFTKGKQAIRADLRLVMVHFRPEAFGEVTGL